MQHTYLTIYLLVHFDLSVCMIYDVKVFLKFSQTKSFQILTILRQSLKSKSDTVEFMAMGNSKVAKTSGFSNECKLFVRGCDCASFDYIYYSRFIKTSRQVVETVCPAEFMTSPRSTSASEICNRNLSLEWLTSLSYFRKS